MGEAIQGARAFKTPTRDDWLAAVIEEMWMGAPTFSDFLQNHVRFVTFNFDAVIEEKINRAVRAIYRSAEVQQAQLEDKFRVIHVHGKLPPIEGVSVEWMDPAASAINVVHDANVNADEVAAALNAIRWANVICFLGFGYHKSNLQRLRLPDLLAGREGTVHVFGSAKDLTQGEMERVQRRLNRQIMLGDSTHGCRDFLAAFDVFRD